MNDFISMRCFLRVVYLKTRDKACNLQLAVVQRYVTRSLKLKLQLIVTLKKTSA